MRLVERALPTALFLHDGWQIVRETEGANATGYLTGLALDEVYRRSTPTGSHDYLTDALGSILGLADSSQAITTSYTYEPYGGTTAQGAASTNPVQYTGRENDGTGLYYYRNRYYSPMLSRFVSEDPIGLSGGLNLYEYVGGDPLTWTDALGLFPGSVQPPVRGSPGRGQLPPAETSIECATRISNAVWARAGPRQENWRNDDKMLHCVISCEIAKSCGVGTSWWAGNTREWRQLFLQGEVVDPNRRRDSELDERANEIGRTCPPQTDCITRCALLL